MGASPTVRFGFRKLAIKLDCYLAKNANFRWRKSRAVLSSRLNLTSCRSVVHITNHVVSEQTDNEALGCNPAHSQGFSPQPPYAATATEAVDNYRENPGATWYKD